MYVNRISKRGLRKCCEDDIGCHFFFASRQTSEYIQAAMQNVISLTSGFPSGECWRVFWRSRCRHEGFEIVWTWKTLAKTAKIWGIFELWCISTPIRRIGLCPLICCRVAAAQSQLLAASTVKNNTVILKRGKIVRSLGSLTNTIMISYDLHE